MKEQFMTRLKNAPLQMSMSSAGATIGTIIMPGIGTTVGMACGGMVSSYFLEKPIK